jgi:predicted DNA-binding transcriptional regulator YafY
MVDVAYQRDPSADPAKLVLPPYGIVYHKGSLYLMAFSPEHQMVRIYKLDRVVAVELQKQHDEPDPSLTCGDRTMRRRPMPQSFASLYFHLISSTKNREPIITEDLESRLYEYLD